MTFSMLPINFSKHAENFLRKAPIKHAKQIVGRIRQLAENPNDGSTAELKGFAPHRRLKSGEYRVIYLIEQNVLQILIIGKRNDDEVYDQLKRHLK